METRISAARTADIQTQTSAPRATPTDQTGTRFADVVAKTAVKGAEQAATMIPGAPVMAVALRSGFQSVPMPSRLNGATSMGAPALGGGVAGAGTGAAGGSAAEGPVAVAASPAETGVESSLAQAQEMNLYFLQIQEQVNAQNRSFTTLSNVLKAEHDTVKTAIGNIR
ncbi:MAG: hypothetical protein JNL38_10050 [Myxococcales bacterium]|nr:hypothetical protein [Myxococcales bacterium]